VRCTCISITTKTSSSSSSSRAPLNLAADTDKCQKHHERHATNNYSQSNRQ
jgi:hypothetical protein